MFVQALNSQILPTYNPSLKETSVKPNGFCYHTLLTIQNQNLKKQMDHFLKFSKMASSQHLSAALNILEENSAVATEMEDHLGCSLEEVKSIRQIFDTEGRLIQLISSDGTLDYKIIYDGNITTVINQITREVHLQEMDNQGRLIREVFPSGLEISWKLDGELLSEITLPDQSKVVYQYIGPDHMNIQRLSPSGEVKYQHAYESENDNLTKEVLIGKAGTLQRHYDETSKTLITKSDYLHVIDQYDEDRNLISRILKDLTEKNTLRTLNYCAGNLLANEKRRLDDQGRVIHYNGFTCSYDEKGRLIQKISADQTMGYKYDAFDRLISVEMGGKKVEYTYDLLGRRLSKTITSNGETYKEFYLYQGVNQIGVYNEDKEPVHQRVLGVAFHTHLPLAIAIESKGKVYAPIHSSNYNILQLIDKDSKEVIHYEALDPFGENLQSLDPTCPWIFATKHFDQDTGLVDFGDRQYDPSIKQWISADPDLRATEQELYTYCNNNPLKYIDPDGQWRINFSLAIPLGIGRGAVAGAAGGIWGIIAGAALGALLGLGLDSAQKKINEDRNKEKLENKHPNQQFQNAVKDVERKLGRRLNENEKRQFHDHISGRGCGYQDLVDEGFHLFDNRYRNN